jgi:hypothetical protein
VLLASLLPVASDAALAVEPLRVDITTISGGRGHSEQHGAQLAQNEVNDAGEVLRRPVETHYADNAGKPEIGVPRALWVMPGSSTAASYQVHGQMPMRR